MEHRFEDVKIPNYSLEGKVAIVTGGTKGLGYATAITFAAYGANVVVASRTPERCERVAKELEEHFHVRALGIPTDVTKVNQIENLIQKTVDVFGKVDIVVANAGIGSTSFAVDVTEEHWDEVVDLDLKAVFFTDQLAAKQMIGQGTGGKIINIASAAGIMGSKALSVYCAAKAGVVNMTKALALEFGRDNILVNAICPGYFKTSLNEKQLDVPKVRKAIEDFTIVKRLANFHEITSGILWLASDCSGYTTGTHLLIDGGGFAR